MTRCWIACAGAVLLLVPAPAVQQQAPVFSARATGVRVDALVTERNVPVRGLTATDFELKDNGVTQDIDIVESSDVPLNVVLAFDGSASTGGRRITDLVDAGNALIAGLKPQDRIALITFNHAVAARVPLTSDVIRVGQALRGLDPLGQSAILDGIHTALMTTQLEAGRSLVIVCTDGQDTQSWLQVDEVTEVARRSNAVIYAVAAGAARRWTDLSDLAELTGGHTIGIERSSDFRAQLVRVLEEFRSRYVLTFTPRGVKAGGFHTLEVKVRRTGVKVRSRPGYVSSPPKGRP